MKLKIYGLSCDGVICCGGENSNIKRQIFHFLDKE